MKHSIERNPADTIKFCHISPTKHLQTFTKHNGAHLLLAHLVEQDESYRNFYANLDDGKVKIMDNSAFEMFKQGRPMYESDKLVEMGKACGADVIVMSDYPKEPWTKTRDAARRMIPELKEAGFGTFYVPQSELGDLKGAIKSFEWAIENPDIDLIGVSILTCPIAFGVNESSYGDGKRSDAYKLQRFLSRWKMFEALNEAGLLWGDKAIKRFHCLGMTDGPNEIELIQAAKFAPFIYSWDSSAAVWAGMNGIKFDGSPSGLMHGKFEKEVEFDDQRDISDIELEMVIHNIRHINNLV
jgi:hypothetical protein